MKNKDMLKGLKRAKREVDAAIEELETRAVEGAVRRAGGPVELPLPDDPDFEVKVDPPAGAADAEPTVEDLLTGEPPFPVTEPAPTRTPRLVSDPPEWEPPQVSYLIARGQPGGSGEWHVRWRPVRDFEGAWMSQEVGPLACLCFRSRGRVFVRIGNMFEGTDSMRLELLNIGGKRLREIMIHPGYAPGWVVERGDVHDPGRGTRSGEDNALKWAPYIGTVGDAGQYFVAGPHQANEGSGAGIYDNIEWAAGTKTGFDQALDLQAYWGNRNAYWRVNRKAWNDGRLVPWFKNDASEWRGVDRSRFKAPVGFQSRHFGEDCPVLASIGSGKAYNQLDHEHLGRATHVTDFVAGEDYTEALVHLHFLAGDVEASWTHENVVDQNPKADNSGYLSAWGIQRVYPHHQGCYWLTRAFGHALWTLAKAHQRRLPLNLGLYSLKTMLLLAEEMADQTKGVIYAIPRRCPAFGHDVTAYDTKLAQYDERIPQGETPRLEVQFESWIIYRALQATRRAAEFWNHHQTADRAGKLLRTMQLSLLGHRSHLRVLPQHAWSDPDGPNWFAWLTGARTASKVEAERRRLSWMADNAANALPGDGA